MAAYSSGATRVERQISLPFNQAFKIALRNITIRLGRAMITGAGTMLGIAFLMSVFASNLMLVAKGVTPSPEQAQKSAWLVAMSLLVSFVGITNSMLMSVTERYKEIGTFKCLGALDKFIVMMFLIESALLGFFGSLAGAILGLLFVLITNISHIAALNWAAVILDVLGCVVLGTVLSVGAALPPAIRAAKMQAVDAMRTEV
ncbi:FtsX-like permease family protein [Abditibacterium utsteinense]|uniref:FtsX-like permease family protein n=1 Tax=Abditibacterium utsteinense TaxID=1960156 RepID=A0A2S8SSK0_9BACT|nr:FtsX-like permease family protein [Abditibacterium utsteinense]PQV63794.1 FtsX-like permease family protein [Abditibacterium utsteinense]